MGKRGSSWSSVAFRGGGRQHRARGQASDVGGRSGQQAAEGGLGEVARGASDRLFVQKPRAWSSPFLRIALRSVMSSKVSNLYRAVQKGRFSRDAF